MQHEKETCIICYEEYNQNNLKYKLSCNHDFHRVCLLFCENNRCPLCIKDFVIGEYNQTIMDVTSCKNFKYINFEDYPNLTQLVLMGVELQYISFLQYLPNLTALCLRDNNSITDISVLSKLTNLTTLTIAENKVEDISPLTGLTKLTELWLDENNITDISPLAELTNLTELVIHSNNITDISQLDGLINLTFISICHNEISDISASSNMTKLTHIFLEETNISDITPIQNLRNIEHFNINENKLSDIKSLMFLFEALNTEEYELNLIDNDICCLSDLENFINLKEKTNLKIL